MKTPNLPNSFSVTTKRLVIRFYQPRDFKVWRDTYSSLPKPKNRWDKPKQDQKELTREKFKKILAVGKRRRADGFFYDFRAFDRKTGELIGLASLMEILRGVFHNAYFGYSVLNPYWGKGYGTEICNAVIDIGFRDLKLHRIEAGIEPDNKPSVSLARKLKMRREGLSKRRLYLRGKWVDIVCYAITSEERGYKHNGGKVAGNR